MRTRKAFELFWLRRVSIPLPFIPLPLFGIQPACLKWQGNKRQRNGIRMAGKYFSRIDRAHCPTTRFQFASEFGLKNETPFHLAHHSGLA